MTADFFDRHERKIVPVGEAGCWIWIGALYRNGYGQVCSGRKSPAGSRLPTGAHRMAFEAENGPIPDGMHVLHLCDVPCCVNPAHLFLGDHAENMRDKEAKRRGCYGEGHGMAKLTARQVRDIRRKYVPRVVTMKHLAAEYGVKPRTIRAVLSGETWTSQEATA